MPDNRNGLDFAAQMFPHFANRIEDLSDDLEFQELCEDLALVAHAESNSGSAEQKLLLSDLFGKLEKELLALLANTKK